ncbi:MAG: hypothetical protein BYD32DRAFT_412274 [Podila humilis]|nr:MAG: hypothetical protein BYD32DRAFT_412274 [Podila humilis]
MILKNNWFAMLALLLFTKTTLAQGSFRLDCEADKMAKCNEFCRSVSRGYYCGQDGCENCSGAQAPACDSCASDSNEHCHSVNSNFYKCYCYGEERPPICSYYEKCITYQCT